MLTISLASAFFYINEPVVDMRENPSDESKVVSQALFSEEVKVKDVHGKWAYIFTNDGYSGWALYNGIVSLREPFDTDLRTSRLKAHLYRGKDIEYGPLKSLPFGSKLKVLDSSDPRWLKVGLPDSQESYIQKGDIEAEQKELSKNELPLFSQKFLGLPYTWGGRSSFGYDCSGFVQMLYGQMGIYLQRDAKQQIMDKRFQNIEIEQLEPGDLLFFGQSEYRILHVGIYIGHGQFIHASARENQPWIRISNLSDDEWSGHKNAHYPYRTARQLINK